MNYHRLGNSGAVVSRLCLGTMNFGMVTDKSTSFRIMDMALDNGIHFFDTANSYGGHDNRGLSECIIGEWFCKEKKRNQVFLADKVYHLSEPTFFNPNDNQGLSAYKIRRHLDDSLRRLQTDHIELYQMHHIDRKANWHEIWSEMDRLYLSGKIIYTGSSNFTAYDLALCNSVANSRQSIGLVSEQHRYNLMCRLPELEILPACSRAEISLLVWGPLSAGRLGDHPYDTRKNTRRSHNSFTDEDRRKIDRYQIFCKKTGFNAAQFALAWLLNNPVVTSVIIGPRTPEQLESCIKALEIDTSEYTEEIESIFPGVGGFAPEVYAW